MEKVIIAVIVASVLFLAYIVWDGVTAEKFSLRKDVWTCTSRHKEPRLMLVGKVMVSRVDNVCDKYERNK